MRPEQLCFFKFQRPLLERFGRDFFRNLPKSPGVYLFRGEGGRVLYIGQSQNLRERLAYYKNAQPEREPRRIIRLVHQTRAIEFECCECAEKARLRELALIGQHRPRFNVANTLSPTYTFFGLRASERGFLLRMGMSPAARPEEELIGAFRNRGLCARAFLALGRALWAVSRETQTIFDFPIWLNSRATEWPEFSDDFREEVEGLLRGEKDAFIARSVQLAQNESDGFLKQVYETDLLALGEFFILATEMRETREFHGLPVVSREALQVSGWQMRRRRDQRPESAARDIGEGEQMEAVL